MIKDFSEAIMGTLMDGMKAITSDGQKDNKARLEASKQSIDFFAKLTEAMDPGKRKKLAEELTSDMNSKLEEVAAEEKKYKEQMIERKKLREMSKKDEESESESKTESKTESETGKESKGEGPSSS